MNPDARAEAAVLAQQGTGSAGVSCSLAFQWGSVHCPHGTESLVKSTVLEGSQRGTEAGRTMRSAGGGVQSTLGVGLRGLRERGDFGKLP